MRLALLRDGLSSQCCPVLRNCIGKKTFLDFLEVYGPILVMYSPLCLHVKKKPVKKPCLKKGVRLSPLRSKMCVLDVRLFFGTRFPAQVQNSRSPVLREGEGLLYEAGLCETGAGNRHRHDDGKTLHATPRWRRGAHTPALGRGRGKKRFCCTCAVKDERCRKLNVPTLSRTQLII